jgi:hypothetical protein
MENYINFTLTEDPTQTERKSTDALFVCQLAATGAATITGTYVLDEHGAVVSSVGGGSGNGSFYP